MKVTIHGLTFSYDTEPVLNRIDCEVGAGEILALVGPNGSGKTTLLKNISGVLKPQQGIIHLDLKTIAALSPQEIAQQLAVVEQEIQPGFDFTVREVVELGRIPHSSRVQQLNAQDHQAIEDALQVTQLRSFVERSIFALSSGERQRVWLAMALAQQPKVLLLDEPTAHLDINYQIEIMDLIKSLANERLTVILAMHDLNLAVAYADRIAVLHQGRIAALGKPNQVLTEALIARVFKARVQIFNNPENGFYIRVVPQQQEQAKSGSEKHAHRDVAAERDGDRLRTRPG